MQNGDAVRRRKPKLRGIESLEHRRLLDGHGAEIVESDVDGDGAVGFLDYLEIIDRFGDKVASGHGDIDGDGTVGVQDFETLTEHFGETRPTDLSPDEIATLKAPRDTPQAQLVQSRLMLTSSDIVNSLKRKGDAPSFLELSSNAQAIFYPVLQAGSATGSPPDTPSDRVDPNIAGSEFDGVGSIEVVHPTLGTFMCTGTVVSPTHVLTAGHCFDVEADGVPDAGATGTFNLNDGSDFSSTHTVSQIFTHPDFTGFANGGNDDLAILELASPVPVSTNIFSVRVGDMTEGETLEMVGYGQAGDGDTGFTVTPSFSVKRVGGNNADLFVVDDEGSGDDEIYFFDFDEPTSSTSGYFGGTTLGNDIETSVGGGDSGGPAFVEVDGEKVIAGLNTFNWELLGSTPPAGFFGSLGGGVILAPYIDWIASISPNAIDANDAPSFNPGTDVEVLEDASTQSINWATNISANNSGQTVDFHVVSNSNPSIFDVAPAIDSTGTLTFSAKPDFNGTAELTVVLQDDGGTAYGGQDTSASHVLTINVLQVNDAPSFSLAADIVIEQDGGAQSIVGFAHDFDPGPLESGQAVAEYIVENDNPTLFLVAPQVDNNGQLTFTPNPATDGVANVSIRVRDTGGTANGGIDTSEALPFSITVEEVDPPPPPVDPPDLAFTLTGDMVADEDTKSEVNGFASGIGEDVFNFQLANDNDSMFRVQPRINLQGVLRFEPKPDAFGVANVTVSANSEDGQSHMQEFQITVDPINDAPSVSIAGDVKVTQGSGAHRIAAFAKDFDPGNAYEASQGIDQYLVKYDNESLFTETPKVNVNGVLTFRLADAAGVANVAVAVRDNGGTENGGQNTSDSYEFSINVLPDVQAPPTGVIRDGQLFIRGSGHKILGLDVRSQTGLLSNGLSAAPFGFFLTETPQHVSLGALGPDNAVSLDGEIATSIRYSGTNPARDLTVEWGGLDGSTEKMEVIVEESPEVNAVLRDGRVVIKGKGEQLLGLDFKSRSGLLSNDSSAAPFRFFLAETPKHVSVGALGAENAVPLNGEVVTSVRYSGTNPARDLTAEYGPLYGATSSLEVTVEAAVLDVVIRNGRIVIEGTSQELIGLNFQSKGGLLSNDASAAPFGFYMSETPENVSLGVLGPANSVTLDGSLVTPVSYSGTDPANDLTAQWGNLSGGPYEFNIRVEQTGLSGFIDSDNYIVLEGIDQKVLGVDFESPDGLLVPLEDGEEKPFQVALSNTKEHISLGALGEAVVVDGLLRTNIRYLGDVDQLLATWGANENLQRLPISKSGDPCAPPSLQTLSDCAETLDERDAILSRLGHVLGDLDGVGGVGFADFLMLAENFGQEDKRYVDGDLDLNGKVTFGDFLLLAENFGRTS